MEIERKWLVKKEKIPYDLEKLESEEIEQAYISFSPTIRVRKIDGRRFILTVKSKTSSKLSREEYETDITKEDYNGLIKKSEGRVISKTRYLNRRADGLLEEIDIFHGEFDGLCYMEIEFGDEKAAEKFPSPEWVEKDVSDEKGYSNGDLAKYGMPKEAAMNS